MSAEPDGEQEELLASGRVSAAKAPVAPPPQARGEGVFGKRVGFSEVEIFRIPEDSETCETGATDRVETQEKAHVTDYTQQHVSTQLRRELSEAVPSPSPSVSSTPDHGEDEQNTASDGDRELWRDPGGELEHGGAEASPQGVDGRAGRGVGIPQGPEPKHAFAAADHPTQQKQNPQGEPRGVCQQSVGSGSGIQRDDESDRGTCPRPPVCQCGKHREGHRRVRATRKPDLQRLYAGYPHYTKWVIETFRETDDTNPKLKRLARWLTRATDVTAPVVKTAKPKLTLKVRGGYVTEPEPEVPQVAKATSSASAGTPYIPEHMAMLQSMAETMEHMKAEIQDLKNQHRGDEERPRKKEK